MNLQERSRRQAKVVYLKEAELQADVNSHRPRQTTLQPLGSPMDMNSSWKQGRTDQLQDTTGEKAREGLKDEEKIL